MEPGGDLDRLGTYSHKEDVHMEDGKDGTHELSFWVSSGLKGLASSA